MTCIWNIKETERDCEFCAVEYCSYRLPKTPKIVTTTQGAFEQADWRDASDRMKETSEQPSIELSLKIPIYVSFDSSDGIRLVKNIAMQEIPPYKIGEKNGEVLCGFRFGYDNFRLYLPIKETEDELHKKIKIFKTLQQGGEE